MSADADTGEHAVNDVCSFHCLQYVFAIAGQQQKYIQCKVNLVRQARHQ